MSTSKSHNAYNTKKTEMKVKNRNTY